MPRGFTSVGSAARVGSHGASPADALGAAIPHQRSTGDENRTDMLRAIAAQGNLAAVTSPAMAADLLKAAYGIIWPLVFHGHTRPLEYGKGHPACAVSVSRLAANCLDGFHDDVEAVVYYLFAYGKLSIRNLEGWISSRMAAAVVDGHRRRRGAVGAQQRPRVPHWLSRAVDHDEWLCALAGRILEWVGIPATAGLAMWPLETWADLRARMTRDWEGSSPSQVSRDVDGLLDAMRKGRPSWYAHYIEQALSHKESPVAQSRSDIGAGLRLWVADDDRMDRHMACLATVAVDAIAAGLSDGRDPAVVVRCVIRTVFLGDNAACLQLDSPPHADTINQDEQLLAVLEDDLLIDRIVAAVVAILGSPTG